MGHTPSSPTGDLPEPARRLIRRVVKRAALTRSERADVEREFAELYRTDPHEFIAQVSNARKTAKRIHREKARQRPWRFRVRVILVPGVLTLAIVFAVLAAAYGALWIRYYIDKPQITRNFCAEFNAPILAIPEEDRAWPIYALATSLTPVVLPDPLAFADLDPYEMGPNSELWPDVLAYHAEIADALPLIRQAAAMPALGYIATDQPDPLLERVNAERYDDFAPDLDPPSENPFYNDVTYSYLREWRDLADLVLLDMRIARFEGDSERWSANFDALLGMARQVTEHPSLLTTSFRISTLAKAMDRVAVVLHEQPDFFSDTQLLRFSDSIRSFNNGRITLELDGDRATTLDFAQRLFTDDGHGDGRFVGFAWLDETTCTMDGTKYPWSGHPLVRPISSPLVGSRKWTVETHDRWMDFVLAQAAGDPWKRRPNPERARFKESIKSVYGLMKYMIVFLRVDHYDRGISTVHQCRQERDATLTAIALELYRREYGSYPGSLAQLVPDLLPELPRDNFTGHVLKYLVTDDSPVLYSVGADRKDDGGRHPPEASEYGYSQANCWHTKAEAAEMLADPERRDEIDGDWVLYPRIHPPEDATRPEPEGDLPFPQ